MANSIDSLNLSGKRVLVRVDFNVPLDDSGAITDDKRIVESLPTIRKIIADGGRAILMSHLGRPKGERKMKYSLRPVAQRLSELLGKPVELAPDCIGPESAAMAEGMGNGDVLLLENLRFHNEEEANDEAFAKQLAAFGDVYINDAFGTAHRAHASTEGVARFVPEKAAGYLLMKELQFLGDAVANPARPFTAILGGSKISGKIDVIDALLAKCDTIIVGGGMMFTFFKAQGKEVGASLVEEDKIEVARRVLNDAAARGVQLLLPTDVVLADRFAADAATQQASVDAIPAGWMGLDIGPATQATFAAAITASKTVVWNGPMGVFEMEAFAAGTAPLPKHWLRQPSTGQPPSSAVEIPRRPLRNLGWKNKCRTSPPAAVLRWSFWKGRSFPGWPRWHSDRPAATHQQLQELPLPMRQTGSIFY
ncbi:MAG: 3-Phosphoglycerate kinase [Chlorobi bacterium OLB7]|nr:MAG: 3-Phosphoglycerate kinase [Chlorobi bacterium OLB7]